MLSGNGALLIIAVPSLAIVGGAISLSNDTAAGEIDLGSLTSGGSVEISGNTSATVVNVNSLGTVSGSLSIDGNTSLTWSLSAISAPLPATSRSRWRPDATAVDARTLGPGGGAVVLTGGADGAATVTVGGLENMDGTLTITGAGGVVVSAEAGLDEITFTGTVGDDTATGSASAANIMEGGGGNDALAGGAAADRISGGEGDDAVSGGSGNDTVIYSGARIDYTIEATGEPNTYRVTDTRAGLNDGGDIVTGEVPVQRRHGSRGRYPREPRAGRGRGELWR